MRKKVLALVMSAIMCIPQGAVFAEETEGILIDDAFAESYTETVEDYGNIPEIYDTVSMDETDVPAESEDTETVFMDEVIVEDEADEADVPEEEVQDGLFDEGQEAEDIIADPEAETENDEEFSLEGGEFEVEIEMESNPKALPTASPVISLVNDKEKYIFREEYFDENELCSTSGKNGDRLHGAGRYIYDTLEDCLVAGPLDSCFISFEDTPQWQYPYNVKAYAGYSVYGSDGSKKERRDQDKITLEENDNSITLLDTSDSDTSIYMDSIQNLVEVPVYLFILDHPEAFRDYLFSYTLKFSYMPIDADMTVSVALESALVEFRPVLQGVTSVQAQSKISEVCSNLYANADYNSDGYVEKTEYVMACYAHLRENFKYANTWQENTQVSDEIRYAATAVPVFFSGYGNKMICSGYADAFSIMMKWYGIPCMTVGGWDHAFNYINLNGEWYSVDSTNGEFAKRKGMSGLGWVTTPMDGMRYPELSEQGLGLEWSVKTEPTCDERGKTEFWSADEFDSLRPYKTEYIASPGHDWEYSETTATCNVAGSRTKTCKRCGESETFDVPSLGHNWVEVSSTGKCTETRTSMFICSRCGEEWSKEVNGGEHRWKLTEDTASCTQDGIKSYVCEVCGETKEEASTATGHAYESEVVTAPTCTQEGFKRSTCSRCGDVQEEAIPARGHAIKDVYVRRYATCTEGKLVQHICVRCGEHVDDEETEPLGHAYVTKTLKYPTCTQEGTSVRICRRCGEQEGGETTIPARGHTYVVWKEYPATCTTRAKTEYKCPVCANLKTEYTGDAPGGHDFENVVTKEPTCTETGIMSKVCRTCGITSGVTEVIPAKGHTWDDGTVTKAPSCTEEGEQLLSCTVCGETKTAVVSKAGHNLEAVETVPPTCQAEGYTVYRCRDCGTEVNKDKTARSGHDWITETTTEPTCTTAGKGVKKCSVCGLKYGDVTLEKKGHTYVADEVVEPTCTKSGYTHYTCSSCGAQKKDDVTGALGHVYDESQAQVTEPTCTRAGRTENTCTRCGQKTTTTTPSLGHDLVLVRNVPQTCLESGYDLSRCARCNEEVKTNYTFVQGQGHNYKVTDSSPAQIGVSGYTVHTCELCGDSKVEYTDPLPEPEPTPAPITKTTSKIFTTAQLADRITISKKPSQIKPKATGKGKISVKWKKFKQTKKNKTIWKKIKKIEIQYSTDASFAINVNSKRVGKKKTSLTLKKLNKNTTYYIRIRYYDGNGGYSNWSTVKKIKTKKK